MDTANFTTDTRKDHCPIRIMYAAANPAAGTLHASELDADPRWTHGRHPIAVIKATEWSDYSGGSVERSNCRAMLEDADMKPHLFQLVGSHGYQALAYDATLGPVPDSWELCNALDGFENHDLVFSDDDLYALERELESEAWDDHGRKDFRKGLTALLNLLDEGHEHEIPDDEDSCTDGAHPVGPFNWSGAGTWREFLVELWRHGCEHYNVNGGDGVKFETGSTVYFYIGEWVKRAETSPSTDRGRSAVLARQLRDDIMAIAHATRIVEEE